MRNYAPTAAAVLADLVKALDTHPDAFQCRIYKADHSTLETHHAMAENPQVIALEAAERRPEYADPVDSRAMIVTPEIAPLLGLSGGDAGANPNAEGEPVILVLKDQAVPRYSFVEWTEAAADGSEQVRMVYIEHSEAVGEAPAVVMKHYGIPAGDVPA